MQMFPDDKRAEQWFIKERWSDGKATFIAVATRPTKSKASDNVLSLIKMLQVFSVRTGTIMQFSKLSY